MQGCGFASSFMAKSPDFPDLWWQIMTLATEGKNVSAEDISVICTSKHQARKIKL